MSTGVLLLLLLLPVVTGGNEIGNPKVSPLVATGALRWSASTGSPGNASTVAQTKRLKPNAIQLSKNCEP